MYNRCKPFCEQSIKPLSVGGYASSSHSLSEMSEKSSLSHLHTLKSASYPGEKNPSFYKTFIVWTFYMPRHVLQPEERVIMSRALSGIVHLLVLLIIARHSQEPLETWIAFSDRSIGRGKDLRPL